MSPGNVPVLHSDGRSRPIYRAPESEPFVMEDSEEVIEAEAVSAPAPPRLTTSTTALPPKEPAYPPRCIRESPVIPNADQQPAGSAPFFPSVFRVGQTLGSVNIHVSRPCHGGWATQTITTRSRLFQGLVEQASQLLGCC